MLFISSIFNEEKENCDLILVTLEKTNKTIIFVHKNSKRPV